jgi:phosphoribosyl 1,2-cyclic phosphodiesterase
MRLKFWGTRGSIAVPGPDTVLYGGNTACLEIVCSSGERIIMDAGTGIRALGQALARETPVDCAVFITHTHWDHIQGLPFFAPLFTPGNKIAIYGTFDPINGKGLKEILAGQMDYNYFPVRSAEFKADVDYESLREGQRVVVGQVRVTPILMNHTVLAFGYKVEHQGRAVFYTGDHEDYANIYDPGDEAHDDYQAIIAQKRGQLVDFLRGVEVMVADGQYTDEEYPTRAGWGHSTPGMCLDLAKAAGIPRLYLTHHEPSRVDSQLEAMLDDLRARRQVLGVEIHLAVEGESLDI